VANKQEVVQNLEALLPEGTVINPDDYTKKELEAMVNLAAKGESIDHLFKKHEDNEDGGASGKAGGRAIIIEDPELLSKVGETEPIPRQDYIKKRFEQDTHRREITEELGVAYQIVFGATRDMQNKHHAPGKRGGRSQLVQVVNDEGEEDNVPRTEYMRQEYQKGRERSDIAQELGVSYGLVYAATKEVERDPEVVEAYKKAHAPEEPEDDTSDDDVEDDEVDEDEIDEGEDDSVFPETE